MFALLALLSLQAATGLFGNDDIAFAGPLNHLVDDTLGARVTGWHRLLADGLFVLLALHLLAIAFHVIVKRHRLIRPMITGLQDVDARHAVAEAGARPWALRTAGGRVARRGGRARAGGRRRVAGGDRAVVDRRRRRRREGAGLGAVLVVAQRAGASACTAASACSTFSTGESPSNVAAMRPSGVTTKVLRSAKPWSICTPRVSLRPGAASRTASA